MITHTAIDWLFRHAFLSIFERVALGVSKYKYAVSIAPEFQYCHFSQGYKVELNVKKMLLQNNNRVKDTYDHELVQVRTKSNN